MSDQPYTCLSAPRWSPYKSSPSPWHHMRVEVPVAVSTPLHMKEEERLGTLCWIFCPLQGGQSVPCQTWQASPPWCAWPSARCCCWCAGPRCTPGGSSWSAASTPSPRVGTLAVLELVLECECSRGCLRGSCRWWWGAEAGWLGEAQPPPPPSGVVDAEEVVGGPEMVVGVVGRVPLPLRAPHPRRPLSMCLFPWPDLASGKSLMTQHLGNLDQEGIWLCFGRTYNGRFFDHVPRLFVDAPQLFPSSIHRSRSKQRTQHGRWWRLGWS